MTYYFGPSNRSTPLRGTDIGDLDATQYASEPKCKDLQGKTIEPGYHFVPGPDDCIVCTCDKGAPKWCQAVLCAPPENCKSFRVVGSTCCDFECLDKTLFDREHPHLGHDSAAELGSRLVAWTVSILVSMSLIYFLFRRLRKKRHLRDLDATQYASEPKCKDLQGKTIEPGYHFVPGPDDCIVCTCDKGAPKWCQAVLCAPPENCKSFRVVGSTCCDFECLDKTLFDREHPHLGHDSAAELGSRLVAWTVSILVSMSLIYFLFRRLRKKRHLSVLRRVFLDPENPGEANPAFSNQQPAFPYLEPYSYGMERPTFPVPPPAFSAAVADSPRSMTARFCPVWKPDDLPPPYSEVVGDECLTPAIPNINDNENGREDGPVEETERGGNTDELERDRGDPGDEVIVEARNTAMEDRGSFELGSVSSCTSASTAGDEVHLSDVRRIDLSSNVDSIIMTGGKTRKILTLVFVLREDEVLLGYKKRGFGVDRWNGFGGKVHVGGESVVDGAKRELLEESGLEAENLSYVGRIEFEFVGDDSLHDVYVFITHDFTGNPVETEGLSGNKIPARKEHIEVSERRAFEAPFRVAQSSSVLPNFLRVPRSLCPKSRGSDL
ncbi:unnamed protein product [Notodromas monacha]|uniref:Oxidized purine nucleoside triphosphate hydrolase n=1 Tax=Notodromas monacha TaxID=399045 RepID=A0A7R9GH48_9CRUS|nr:unnamed protein product [Notodromas monacha]CAG0921105.1 unnamed protein product [Notodromas monacha]